MSTTGQRLASLSGLSGVSAGAHLLAIRMAGGNAGQMLASRSGLGSSSALAHLMATPAALPANPGVNRLRGLAFSMERPSLPHAPHARRARRIREREDLLFLFKP